MVDYKNFVENSRKWLKKYIQNNHLKSIIIGISGGIDSTVSCAIASPVCKELNIPLIGRSLPTSTNKKEETDTANLAGNAFCTDYKEISIDNPFASISQLFLDHQEGVISKLQSGNIKARIRMIYLRHLASVNYGVVLDNDNFTEWNLGFWTVGGDSPMDINLGLHYLWKTEIYELADYLKEELNNRWHSEKYVDDLAKDYFFKVRALEAAICITPTDGNGVSNSDCDQFGLDNYVQVDDVLKTVYHTTYTLSDGKSKEEYIRLIDSYNEQGVDKVMMLHQNTVYKRKELPIKPTRSELGLI